MNRVEKVNDSLLGRVEKVETTKFGQENHNIPKVSPEIRNIPKFDRDSRNIPIFSKIT